MACDIGTQVCENEIFEAENAEWKWLPSLCAHSPTEHENGVIDTEAGMCFGSIGKLENRLIPQQLTWRITLFNLKEKIRESYFPEEAAKIGFWTVSYTWRRHITPHRVFNSPWAIQSMSADEIMHLCELLTILGAKYVWMDVLCIDQSDVRELALSTKSMSFVYGVCIACLVKLSTRIDDKLEDWTGENFQAFAEDRWWKRVWTFQESILPPLILFAVGNTHPIEYGNLIGAGDKIGMGGDEYNICFNNFINRWWPVDIECAAFDEIRNRGCSKEEDRVYGILGLIAWGHKVDVKYNVGLDEAITILNKTAVEENIQWMAYDLTRIRYSRVNSYYSEKFSRKVRSENGNFLTATVLSSSHAKLPFELRLPEMPLHKEIPGDFCMPKRSTASDLCSPSARRKDPHTCMYGRLLPLNSKAMHNRGILGWGSVESHRVNQIVMRASSSKTLLFIALAAGHQKYSLSIFSYCMPGKPLAHYVQQNPGPILAANEQFVPKYRVTSSDLSVTLEEINETINSQLYTVKAEVVLDEPVQELNQIFVVGELENGMAYVVQITDVDVFKLDSSIIFLSTGGVWTFGALGLAVRKMSNFSHKVQKVGVVQLLESTEGMGVHEPTVPENGQWYHVY
ncbi:hypothetical protein HK098_002201 [Nowakowskiella sp. JEL0407]|nr:hypothetical protein HK098_002201 [Nowakowskiella sp. JEL0407]